MTACSSNFINVKLTDHKAYRKIVSRKKLIFNPDLSIIFIFEKSDIRIYF